MSKKIISWQQYFMGVAKLSAYRSKDPNTQVGACIVSPENKIVGVGYNDMSLIECRLETGRTHQIRVHMSYIGYPVYGDPKYGKKKDDQSHGQFLHAKKLGFIHPTTGEYLEFECPLPDYFQAKLDELKGE